MIYEVFCRVSVKDQVWFETIHISEEDNVFEKIITNDRIQFFGRRDGRQIYGELRLKSRHQPCNGFRNTQGLSSVGLRT